MHLLLFTCISAFLHHVENVALEYVAAEAEDPEEVNQEEQLQELEAAEQVEEPTPEANFANFISQPGKHRFINPSVLHNFKLYAI